MKLNKNPKFVAICAAIVIFNFSSCKYEDGPSISLKTKTSRLSGEWEVKSVDGESLTGGDGTITLEFDKGGDLTYTYSFGTFDSETKGDWEWGDKKESIEVDFDGLKTDWDVTRLTNKEFEFDDEDGDKWILEKI